VIGTDIQQAVTNFGAWFWSSPLWS